MESAKAVPNAARGIVTGIPLVGAMSDTNPTAAKATSRLSSTALIAITGARKATSSASAVPKVASRASGTSARCSAS